MLLRRQKILFVHIPRTGGSAIKRYWRELYNIKPSIFSLSSGKNGHSVNLGHSPYDMIKQDWVNSGERFDEEWLQFSIVRNPYDKVMSELFFWPDLGVSKDFQTHKDLEFRQQKILQALDPFINNRHIYNKEWMWDHHLYPQNWFLKNIPDNFKIFKFEEGTNNIMDRLGFEQFKHNSVRAMDVKQRYGLKDIKYEDLRTPEFIKIVNQYYKEDFERFGYEML